MSEREPPPDKQDVARSLMLRGSVFVYLDPRAPGVRVPAWLAKQPQLVLQVGLDLPVPIPDLRVDDSGISGTLSFNRAPFTVAVGWDAVFALVGDGGMGMVWREDLPDEVAAEVEAAFEKGTGQPPPPPRIGRTKLRAIEGGASKDRPPSDRPGDAFETNGVETNGVETSGADRARLEIVQARPADEERRTDDGGASEIDDDEDGPSSEPPQPGGLPPYLRVIK